MSTWAYQPVLSSIRNENATLLQEPPKNEQRLSWNSDPLSNSKVTNTFQANHNQMGMVLIRFNTGNVSRNGEIDFKLKEARSEKWIYEQTYKTDQIQNETYFPFGFPIIENSKGKSYEFEISSNTVNINDAVSISVIEPAVTVGYSYNREYLQNNPIEIIDLGLFHLRRINLTPTHIADLALYLAAFVGIAITVHESSKFTHHRIRSSAKLQHLSDRIDDMFFLKQRNITGFDGLRAWAIIMVLTTHLNAPLDGLIDFNTASPLLNILNNFLVYFPFVGTSGGAIGVDLFFILSAFLIFVALSRKNEINFFHFMKRRFERLFPAHAVVVLPLLLGVSFVGLILNLFFLAEFFSLYSNVNFITWTLSYEFVFYVIAALWLIAAKKYPFMHTWKFFFGFAITVFLSGYVLTEPLSSIHLTYPEINRFMAFFFGIGLAKLYLKKGKVWNNFEKVFYYAIPMSLVFIMIFRNLWKPLVFELKWGQLAVDSSFLILDAALFIVVGSMLIKRDHVLKRLFSNKALRVIGVVSYSLYLNHLMWGQRIAIGIVEKIPNEFIRFFIFPPLSMGLSFLIAVLLFYYLERPYFLKKKTS